MDVEHVEGPSPRLGGGGSPAIGGESTGGSQQNVCRSASSTRMETIKFHHRWTIEQFSIQLELSSVGDFLTSSAFGSEDGRYKFLLKLFPAGKDEECRGYLSLFLQIQKCPNPKLRFRVNFYIETTDGPRGCALNRSVVTINKGGIVTASKFYSADTLKSRSGRFIPDDVLTVGVELVVFGEHTSREISSEEAGQIANLGTIPSLGSLGCELGRLLEDKDHTDVILKVGDRQFHAHKAVLAARSPVFGAMFGHQENKEQQNSEAQLEDVTPDSVQALLEFIYTDYVDVSNKPGDILAASDKYCLDRLKAQCETALSQDLSVQNLCERLRLADCHSAASLRRRVLNFFGKHKVEILDSQDWTDLQQDCPILAATVLKEILMVATQDEAVNDRLSLGEPQAKKARVG